MSGPKRHKICVVGLGFVGVSNAVLLARFHDVVGVDIDPLCVAAVQARRSPVADDQIARSLREDPLSLSAVQDGAAAFAQADYVVIATPTDYDPATNVFDTSRVEAAIASVRQVSSHARIVIKSTVPVGFTEECAARLGIDDLLVSPEFLREGRALYDNLYPSRIVVGGPRAAAHAFGQILAQGALAKDVPVVLTDRTEAEAIKLFSNTYLAMRVAYFNELDSYAMARGLDARQIIEGVGYDPRIGTHYNNPSFGYGGYCLPKDTKQLLANYEVVPQNLIQAIVEANRTRKDVIADAVLARDPQVVGIYRLVMKSGSQNFRKSAMWGVMKRLRDVGVQVVVFEPLLDRLDLQGCQLDPNLETFKAQSDVILTNRHAEALTDVAGKVFTRDLFHAD